MVTDDDLAPDALIDLALFEEKMSPDGRLLHFAKGRIRTFWLRQTLTAFGSITILLLASWQLGLGLAALALMGEGFDILLLRRVVHRLEQGWTDWRNRALVMLGAGVQAATIAGCVALCWQAIPTHESRFFAAAFLASAGINAGLARALFRPAADLRLLIFLLVGFAMMAVDLMQFSQASTREYGFFAAGFGLLIYITLLLIRMLERNYEQRRDHEYVLLNHQYQQQLAQQQLAQRAADSQRLALVAKYANDSIIILDPQGRIDWVNDAFTRITGYGFDEAVGKFPADLLNAPDTDPATLDKLQKSRDAQIPVRVEQDEIRQADLDGNLDQPDLWPGWAVATVDRGGTRHQRGERAANRTGPRPSGRRRGRQIQIAVPGEYEP